MAPKKSPKTSKTEKSHLIDLYKLSIEHPELAAAQTIAWILYSKRGYSIEKATALIPTLTDNATQLQKGDLQEAERILLSQAEVLQALFHRMFTLAGYMMTNPEQCDRYISLGLRAQEQCRKTLVSLSEIKNPKKPTQLIKNYVDKQLNQLKVEQSQPPMTEPDFGNAQETSQSFNTQAMEASPYAPMDTRSKTAATRTDSDMETVESLHRPDNE
ncbi:MAG: hypothetical protein ACTS2F_16500 [Thainema sp.]